MPVYLTKAKYHPAGVQGLVKEGASGRKAAVTKLVEAAGGKLHAFYFALGETDAYLITEFADRHAAMGVSIAVNASGATSVTQVELLSVEEMDAALRAVPAYRPPGA
jgi:uncharacterized protein with GYD domain